MRLAARLRLFAQRASLTRLGIALAATGAALTLNVMMHRPVEEALASAGHPLARPEMRASGINSIDVQAFLEATRTVRSETILALVLADPPLIVALGLSLALLASLVARGMPLKSRTRTLMLLLPAGFALADLVEDALLVLALADRVDTVALIPWATALKFGLLFASIGSSAMVGLARFALDSGR